MDALARASLEVGTRDGDTIPDLAAALPAGTDIHITMLAQKPAMGRRDETVALARQLTAAGFRPVPHIAVRNMESAAALDTFLHRLTGEAGVSRVFLVAGDRPAAAGPFTCSLDVLAGGHLPAAGITAVGFAGHPEGHPAAAMDVLERALADKVCICTESGLDCWVVSQFCFAADPIVRWLRRLNDVNLRIPVKVGIAGPAPAQKLLTYAMRCGVGASLRALTRQGRRYGRLARYDRPESLVREVLARTAAGEAPAIAGFHVFPFAGARLTCAWMAEFRNSRVVESG